MYLFQFHMPLILCTSAIISPALVLCVKQAAAVNLHLSNAVFFHSLFEVTTQNLLPHCVLLPASMRSRGRPSVF